MLLTVDGHVKLADFGLSTEDELAATSDTSATPADGPLPLRLRMGHVARGTPDFLAPELLKCSGYSYEVTHTHNPHSPPLTPVPTPNPCPQP